MKLLRQGWSGRENWDLEGEVTYKRGDQKKYLTVKLEGANSCSTLDWKHIKLLLIQNKIPVLLNGHRWGTLYSQSITPQTERPDNILFSKSTRHYSFNMFHVTHPSIF